MGNERLRSVERNRYDGGDVLRTKNCVGCQFQMSVDGQKRCYWGKAWKRIFESGKPLKKCNKIDRPSPRESRLREIEDQDLRINILGVRYRQLELHLS